MSNKPNLVATAVAAIALGITEAAVRQLAARGKLTAYGNGHRRKYDLYECQAIRRTRQRGV